MRFRLIPLLAVLVLSFLVFSCALPKEEVADANFFEYKGTRYAVADAAYYNWGTYTSSSDPTVNYRRWTIDIGSDGLEYDTSDFLWTGFGHMLSVQLAFPEDTFTGTYRAAVAIDPGDLLDFRLTLDYNDDGEQNIYWIESSESNVVTVAESGGVYTVTFSILMEDETLLTGNLTGTLKEEIPG